MTIATLQFFSMKKLITQTIQAVLLCTPTVKINSGLEFFLGGQKPKTKFRLLLVLVVVDSGWIKLGRGSWQGRD